MSVSLSNIKKILLSTFVVAGGFFFFVPVQVDAACQVVLDSSTRFRTAFTEQGGAQPDSFLLSDDQSQLPFVYLDVNMTGCDDVNTVYLHVLGLRDDSQGEAGGVTFTIDDHPVSLSQFVDDSGNAAFTQAFRADEGPCYGDNSDVGGSDCLILGLITDTPRNANPNILGVVGNLLGRVSLESAQSFVSLFSTGEIIPSSNCEPIFGYLYQVTENCDTASYGFGGGQSGLGLAYSLFPGQQGNSNQKLVDYYNSRYNTSFQVLNGQNQYASVAFPALTYNCNGNCAFNDEWTHVGNPIEYGTNHPDDNGPTVTSPLASNYQNQYIPLAPLPFEGLNGGETPSLPDYISGLFEAAIIVLIVLAVIMIVFAGITHFFSATATGKEGKRELAWNALIGLGIALGSWLLLNTISPELASNLSIQIPAVSIDGYDYIEDGIAVQPSSGCPKPEYLPPSCPTCQTIDSSITLKPEVAANGHNTISGVMSTKLVNFQNTLSQNNISWRITEAFSPTFMGHCSSCHYNGTCIDANFTSATSPTVENIQAFISAAASAGLRAVYETNSGSFYQTLKDAGIPLSNGNSGNLLWLQNITAPHFSVYNQ